MSYIRLIWRKLKPLAALAACWLAVHGTALARTARDAEEEEVGGSWVPSYGLVLLCIVLGMLGVCLATRRREREKPETYAKSEFAQDDKS